MPASGAELEGELGLVLADLRTVDAAATEIEERAREHAQRLREDAARDAAAMIAEARVTADAERARAAAELHLDAERGDATVRDEAAREIQRIAAVRDERVDQLVVEVSECVRRHSGR